MRNSLLLLLLVPMLTGCGRGVDQATEAAERARVRTERLVDAAQNASNRRQAQIFADAAQMDRQEAVHRDGPRYEARKTGAGDDWTIYDNTTGAPATVGTQVQTGLTREKARANLSRMLDDDETPSFRQ